MVWGKMSWEAYVRGEGLTFGGGGVEMSGG